MAPGEDPVHLDTLRDLMGYNLRRASGVFQSDLTETLKPHDLRMITFSALALIADNPGLSQTRLADALDIERPNLVAIIDELEQAGLIVRDRVPTDRRIHALMPTGTGLDRLNRALTAVRDHERRLLNGLDTETTEILIGAMRTILHQTGSEDT